MWLHWGPQSIGEDGDWYAKWIYMPQHAWGGYTRVYPHHLERVGHPSEFGYKDMLPLWKAEKWDPDKLMALYKRAGARYVIGQGMHHDNFDLWDSSISRGTPSSSVPHRDNRRRLEESGRQARHPVRHRVSRRLFALVVSAGVPRPISKGRKVRAVRRRAELRRQGHMVEEAGAQLKDLYGIDLKDDVVFPPEFQGRPHEFRMRDPLSHGIPDGDLRKHRDFRGLVRDEMDAPGDRRHRPVLAGLHLLRRRW